MDKNEHSIFAYVMDKLDENGIYQGGALIDDPTPSLPRPLGSDDAYIYTAEMPPDLPGAEAVCSMLLAYADEPSATAKAVLEEALIKILCVSVCDPLVELLSEDEVPEPLLALAEDWLYTAHKRELVKYAIVILAVFGLEKLRKEHSENLWGDLVDLCRCEEFTFSLPLPTVSIILHHRTSYGNLFALPEAGDVYSPSMILNALQKKKKFGCFGTVVKSKSIMLRFVW